jgi:nucleoid-associated protein YejK
MDKAKRSIRKVSRQWVRYLLADLTMNAEINFDELNQLLDSVNLKSFVDVNELEQYHAKGRPDFPE